MKELVKAIRKASGMSQEQFAKELGTTPISINRWENGKTIPNNITQKVLYQFCIDKSINLIDMILKRNTYIHDNSKFVLYHGSKKGIEGDIAPISREECDFGKGFYMGTTTLQPLTLVCAEEKPKLYTIELDVSGLKVLNVEIGMDWAMLIAYFRKEMESAKGSKIYDYYANFAKGYDLVVGYIANDRMYVELARFFNGTLTDTALINCLSALDLGMQYVAISQKACNQIKVLRETELSQLELLALRDMSKRRRKEGIELADEIERKYRREGRYFDEILRGEFRE